MNITAYASLQFEEMVSLEDVVKCSDIFPWEGLKVEVIKVFIDDVGINPDIFVYILVDQDQLSI